MTTRERVRTSPSGVDCTVQSDVISNGVLLTSNLLTTQTILNTETCIDQTNPGPPYRSGGNLDIIKEYTEYSTGTWDYKNTHYLYHSGGTIRSIPDSYGTYYNMPANRYWNESAMTALGTEGWARFRPLRPNMDLNQTIAELKDFKRLTQLNRDSLRNFFKEFKDPGKAVAKGHLSWQFGVKPLIDDIFSMSRAYDFTDKRIKFIRANNGKSHRRGGTLREFTDVDRRVVNLIGGLIEPSIVLSTYEDTIMPRTEVFTSQRKAWFKGKFGFYLPVEDTPQWERKILRQQGLGLRTSFPALLRTIYQITPWSWLIDWAVSTGDILSNAVAIHEDGVYADYAYVMAHEKYTLDSYVTPTVKSVGVLPLHTRRVVEYKTRREATPFGFGLVMPDELSAWQLGILAALGVSRRR